MTTSVNFITKISDDVVFRGDILVQGAEILFSDEKYEFLKPKILKDITYNYKSEYWTYISFKNSEYIETRRILSDDCLSQHWTLKTVIKEKKKKSIKFSTKADRKTDYFLKPKKNITRRTNSRRSKTRRTSRK